MLIMFTCVFFYLFPFLLLDDYGVLLLISAISATFFMDYNINESDKVNDREKYKDKSSTFINIKPLRKVLFGFTFLALAFVVPFLLWFLSDKSLFSQGIKINGVTYVPSLIILYYLFIPFLWNGVNKKGHRHFGLYINKKLIVYSFLLCFPRIIIETLSWLSGAHSSIYVAADTLAASIFQAVVTAAFIEELFFRGFVYGELKDILGSTIAKLISSLLFSIWHLNLISQLVFSYDISYLLNLFAIFVLGIATTIIYDYSGSLIPCIILHALGNGAYVNSLSLVAVLLE